MPVTLAMNNTACSKALGLAALVAIAIVFGLSTMNANPHDNTNIARNIHNERHSNITIYEPPYNTHNAPHSNLTARDTIWEDKVYKGHWLACLMNAQPEHVEQSHFTTNADLTQNGWQTTERPAANQRTFNLRGYVGALKGLGLDTNFEHWITVQGRHAGTGGQYTNAYNPWGGILIAESNHGPDFVIGERTKKGIAVGPAPALKNWSDVVFLVWAMLCRRSNIDQNPQGLEHVFRSMVVNEATTETLRQARGNGNSDGVDDFPPKWPGWSWNIDTDPGRAAISTPNGVGVAYFLFQHKEALGIKVVDRIHAFNCPDYTEAPKFCMYMHLVDGPIDHI
ncbi:hypothetical protein CLAFUW4_11643 [Fulvia fulva]|nr:hypothetical protein CLAFUR4_11648 [Fulvia fulva]WPV17009.1 hypothetical protein CLAFUW4_11643 [Fulvia fulva]